MEKPRLPKRMQRINQRAHRFVDRKKEKNRKEARGRKHDE